MPKISHRGKQMPASPIRKLVPYAEAAKRRGVHVYHLNIGQPDIETPPVFWEAVKNAGDKVLAYTQSQGNPSLRESFAAYYNTNDILLDPEQFLVTTGGSEALRFAFMSCLNPGDELIIPEPFYANYLGFAIEAGVKVIPLTTKLENNFDLPNAAAFESVITEKTKGILLCNPANPTGKVYDKATLLRLQEIVLKHDLYLFSDEVYREFCYEGQQHFSALKLDKISSNVIVIDSVSKRYSACGARIGLLVSRNSEVVATALKYAQARLSPPALSQIGVEALLTLPQSYFEKTKAIYAERRNTLIKALSKIPGIKIPTVSGAFYLIAQLPVEDAETFCQWLLEEFEYEGATVMVAPAAGFYATPGLGRQEVRIAYVLENEDLEKAMRCLEEALKAYPNKASLADTSVLNAS